MKLVDQLARVDEKLDSLREQYRIDVDELKSDCERIQVKLDDLEKRRSELIKEIESTKNEFNKWKIYWTAVAFFVAPTITCFIVWVVHFVWGF